MLEDMLRHGVIEDSRQPLVIPRRSSPEERGLEVLRRLQETKRYHKKGLFPGSPGLLTFCTRLLELNGSPIWT
jgi:hypothetical protein